MGSDRVMLRRTRELKKQAKREKREARRRLKLSPCERASDIVIQLISAARGLLEMCTIAHKQNLPSNPDSGDALPH
jgi:hypothetical protein